MLTDQHPITPPPELVEQWYDAIDNSSTSWKQELATQAARWGADQELQACLQLLDINGCPSKWIDMLRAARRRPKPPSLKEQALEILGYPKDFWSEDEVDTIRRALERLQELEEGNE